MLGHNGHLKIVPGTDWAAVSVCASWAGHEGLEPGTWIYTDVRHVGDDPLWEPLPETGVDGPDNAAINAVHGRAFRATSALTREFGRHISGPMDAAAMAQSRKRLREKMATLPDWRSVTLRNGDMGVVRLSGSVDYECS